ncbi:class I SAM-dependent methyltransferase [Rhabdothermincola salaria]|uniref:class I SAM-dependent methyltransferase n=1 Tax=Rhabdothermincola salaria TaxID=2903142 RepID=UPI001E51D866|nr:class I SAM-dependent methyltransferase [Rhabdothermincola salaria]MCD9623907.1 methyltransferase domain-containing protein [Rhabdothermincola salaria]
MADIDEDAAAVQRHIWTIGDYPAVARRMFEVAESTVELAGIDAGQRVLDVATGDGNAALLAVRRGASVVGVDLTPAQLDKALTRLAAEGVTVELRPGDAQALDIGDDEFDVVISVLGMIFAPDHAAALREMVRVCRPGGTVAAAAWAEGGWMGRWRAAVAEQLAPGSAPTPAPNAGPDAWGDPDEVRRRFAAVGLDVELHERVLDWSFPSPEAALDFYLEASGPFIAFMDGMRRRGLQDEARQLLHQCMVDADTSSSAEAGCHLESPYLVMVARLPR